MYLFSQPSFRSSKIHANKNEFFSHPSVRTGFLSAQKNHLLLETVLLSTQNICFGLELRKFFFDICMGESSKFPKILNFHNSNLKTFSMPTNLNIHKLKFKWSIVF